MKKSLLVMTVLLSVQCVIGQEQVGSTEQQSRFKKIANFIIKNKGCLTGTECKPGFSFLLNFMLGVAFALPTIGFSLNQIDKFEARLASEHERSDLVQAGLMFLAGSLVAIIRDLGYQKFVQDVSSLKGVNTFRCLTRGTTCTLEQRQYLFYWAGSVGGSLGAIAIEILRDYGLFGGASAKA